MVEVHEMPEDRLWTVEETSYFLGVPVGTLYYWRCRGDGPKACKLGRHLRYRADDVRAWVASHTGRVA
jgi:predicted DNA-binding transcriptional regulator AlpA